MFEVCKRGGVYVAFPEKAVVGLLCVKCRRQINNWAESRWLALFKICNGIWKIGASVIEHC